MLGYLRRAMASLMSQPLFVELSDVVEQIEAVAFPAVAEEERMISPQGNVNILHVGRNIEKQAIEQGTHYKPPEGSKRFEFAVKANATYVAQGNLKLPQLTDQIYRFTFGFPSHLRTSKYQGIRWTFCIEQGETLYSAANPHTSLAMLLEATGKMNKRIASHKSCDLADEIEKHFLKGSLQPQNVDKIKRIERLLEYAKEEIGLEYLAQLKRDGISFSKKIEPRTYTYGVNGNAISRPRGVL